KDPMRHPVAQSEFLATSEVCGQCHDITNPLIMGHRADGTPTGRPFVIERTFSEWQASAFPARGETCQSCHMPELEEPVRAASEGEPREYSRRHDLVGGNYWVPRAIAATIPDPEGTRRRRLNATAD